jgi:hypothetical protein
MKVKREYKTLEELARMSEADRKEFLSISLLLRQINRVNPDKQ